MTSATTTTDNEEHDMTTDITRAEKIAKLLAKAENAGTEAEAETFLAGAARLQAQWEIDQTLVEQARGQLGQGENPIETKTLQAKGKYTRASIELANNLAHALGLACAWWHNTSYGPERARIEWMGTRSDLERAEVLYNSLLIQMEKFSRLYMKTWDGGPYWREATQHEKFMAKRSHMVGFGIGAASKVRQERQKVVAEHDTDGNSAALVLVKKSELVKAAQKEAHGDLREARKIQHDRDALRQGVIDGKSADMGARGALGGSSRKAIR